MGGEGRQWGDPRGGQTTARACHFLCLHPERGPKGWDPQLLANGKVKADAVFEIDGARRMQRV